jgi:hypothetical protein
MNRAAMSLVKKHDADSCLSAIRNKRRRLSRPMRQADGVNSSKIMPDRPLANRLTFVEDFAREHSLRGGQVASSELRGSF